MIVRTVLFLLLPLVLLLLPFSATAAAGCPTGFSKGPFAPGVSARAALQLSPPPPLGTLPPLQVGPTGRYLVTADGAPFFWLGDTAWLLSQKTTRDDVDLYLSTRAQQGFTVIQAAAVMGEERVGGTLVANLYGDQAFIAGNPSRPDVTAGSTFGVADEYDYWDHVDYIVGRAAAYGLRLALLPMFVGFNSDGYKFLTPDRAYEYGAFLGGRYGQQPHVIWVLGGDNTPDTSAKQSVWHDMARGITVAAVGAEDYSRTLMTYHINGNFSSSQWFHDAPWLDFNMVQVWGNEPLIYPRLSDDYARMPVKPTGLAEGSYEDGPLYSTRPIDALKIRRQAYWSYLAGGYHTYGNTNTWNFGSVALEATQDWRRALDAPGALHLSVLARTFASLPWWRLEPHPALLASGPGPDTGRHVATRSAEGDLALVYLGNGGPVEVNLQELAPGATFNVTWIDPRSGLRQWSGEVTAGGSGALQAPQGWDDALLLLVAR